MLTGKLVRVRHRKNQVIPLYVSPHDTAVRLVAEQLITLYRQSVGRRRGQLEEELADLIPEGPQGLLPAGLAHLLEERCTFETTAPLPPEEVRAVVFALAAQKRQQWAAAGLPFDRRTILAEAASHFGPLGTAEKLDQALFADLKCEQRITSFEDISVDRLLDRYNVALAQAVLLRAVRLDVDIEGETPARFRQLFRALKFHRLIASIQAAGPDRYHLQVDGPLSLFSATQKYGLQLALFLPSLLHCRRFSLCAQLRWSYGNRAARDKTFTLSSADGLRSHLPDFGTYTPPELEAFIQSFANKNYGWSLQAEPLHLRQG
ncbi:MAG: DUF790 family protein, partial [Gemmataceae bacterium]|nr:DUF790 family protein [Gemmataceae bacterium]